MSGSGSRRKTAVRRLGQRRIRAVDHRRDREPRHPQSGILGGRRPPHPAPPPQRLAERILERLVGRGPDAELAVVSPRPRKRRRDLLGPVETVDQLVEHPREMRPLKRHRLRESARKYGCRSNITSYRSKGIERQHQPDT
ncbi:hypothetical protein ACPA54_06840 [Uniformispora flossi]|uniref:hypothetical protein n=1 Tax=Uniformispora flossi TaxID=3390723 RepID=UPI003C2D56DF